MEDVWAAVWPAMIIALLRMTDVTLSVFKTVAVVQGRRAVAPILQGAESLMWLFAAGIVFAEMTPIRIVGFAIGVMAGTVTGMEVIRKLQLGMVTVRIYSSTAPRLLRTRSEDESTREFSLAELQATEGMPERNRIVLEALHDAGHRATVFRGEGRDGAVEMTLCTVRRREAQKVMDIARAAAPDAFVSIDNDVHPSPLETSNRA